MIASSFPLLFLIIDSRDIWFDYRVYTCDYKFSSKVWKNLRPALTIIFLFVPNIIIAATTIPTLMYLAAARKCAKKVRGSIPWQGALTVALTAIVCFISTMPLMIYYTIWGFLDNTASQDYKTELYFARVAKFLMIINILSNFYIYLITLKSFRKFAMATITKILSARRSH